MHWKPSKVVPCQHARRSLARCRAANSTVFFDRWRADTQSVLELLLNLVFKAGILVLTRRSLGWTPMATRSGAIFVWPGFLSEIVSVLTSEASSMQGEGSADRVFAIL